MRQKKYAATNDSKGFSTTHDYIIFYQKSDAFNRNLIPRTEEQMQLGEDCPPLDTGFMVFKLDSSNIKFWDGIPVGVGNGQLYFDKVRNVMDKFRYRLSSATKEAIAQNLIDALENDAPIEKSTNIFVSNWILTGPCEKEKAFLMFGIWC